MQIQLYSKNTKPMVTTLPQFQKPSDFAKVYINKNGKKGVTRNFIYQLIKKEEEEHNSTDIDVLIIGGAKFVKYRSAPTQSQQRANQ